MSGRHLKTKTSGVEGTVAEVYRQIRKEFGVLGEPLTLHAALPALLAGVWCSFRESILAGQVPRKHKEAVAVAVSKLNQCPYCIDAHVVLLRATSEHDAAAAIQEGEPGRIKDARVRAVAEWALATRTPGSAKLLTPPFTAAEAPEIIGTALWIHYINRVTKVLLGGRLIPIRSDLFGLRSLSERMGGLFFARAVGRRLEPGASLTLLADAPLPPDLCWAEPAPAIARAFAGFSLATEQAGSKFLAEDVRSWARERLKAWNGSDPGLGRAWLPSELDKLQEKHRPAGRLVLLSALAPDQVDRNVVGEFRQADSSDAALLGAVAWSSFSAARVIGCWMVPKVESILEPNRPQRSPGATFPIDRDSSFA